jgi:nitrogenase molybdenum-iron protein alpha chain
MDDTVVIIHGAVGCGGPIHSQGAAIRLGQWKGGDPNPSGVLWLSTNISESEVVNGAEGKLRETVIEADRRYRPDTIVIVSTCVPEIIGDDIDGVAGELSEHVSATIVPVHCEGFKTKIMASAYDGIFHSFMRNLIDGKDELEVGIYEQELTVEEIRLRRSRTVNLLNVSSMTGPDENELIRLLNRLGLEVNMLPCDAHPDAVRNVPFAALSVGVCPTHDDYFLRCIEEEFGVPHFSEQIPIGIENTGIWLREIAKRLGLEDAAERVIADEHRELDAALAPILPHLKGRTAMISAGEIRTLATAVLLQEYGMELLAVRPYHYDEFGGVEIEKLERVDPNIRINVATAQPFEAVNIIRRVRPDLYIGHNSDTIWAAKCGAAILPVYGAGYTYCGYAGAYDLAKRIKRHFSNNAFNRKLAQNTRQPYRESWYGEDPYKYIKEGPLG